jgi:hypothetical protein
LKPATLKENCLPGIIFPVEKDKWRRTFRKDSMKPGGWKVIGPGGGVGILLPTISPFDENFGFA